MPENSHVAIAGYDQTNIPSSQRESMSQSLAKNLIHLV